jgi:hypothetical protein
MDVELGTVGALARAKLLPERLLRTHGFRDDSWRENGQAYPSVSWPMRDAEGRTLYRKHRLANGEARLAKPRGQPLVPFSLPALARFDRSRGLFVVEGESDVLAALVRGEQALGLPSASGWRAEYAEMLTDFSAVYLWEEPDLGGERLVVAVARDVPRARVVTGGGEHKDLCGMHVATDDDFATVLAERVHYSVPIMARATTIRAKEPPRFLRQRHEAPGSDEYAGKVARAKAVPFDEVCESLGLKPKARAGRELRFACPIHGGERGSLAVNRERGVYFCHACQAKGDTIDLVMAVRGVNFRQAVEALAS